MFGLGKNTEKMVTQSNQRTDNSEKTILRLSDDIGKMADRIGNMAERIGQMADRIGDMADRIQETQNIQGKNLELMQETVSDVMKMMSAQAQNSNKMLELLVQKSSLGSPLKRSSSTDGLQEGDRGSAGARMPVAEWVVLYESADQRQAPCSAPAHEQPRVRALDRTPSHGSGNAGG